MHFKFYHYGFFLIQLFGSNFNDLQCIGYMIIVVEFVVENYNIMRSFYRRSVPRSQKWFYSYYYSPITAIHAKYETDVRPF